MGKSGRDSNRYGSDGYEYSLDPYYDTEVKRKYKPVCLECAKPMSYEFGQDGICNKCIGIEEEEF